MLGGGVRLAVHSAARGAQSLLLNIVKILWMESIQIDFMAARNTEHVFRVIAALIPFLIENGLACEPRHDVFSAFFLTVAKR
jgi:hypothetical protein